MDKFLNRRVLTFTALALMVGIFIGALINGNLLLKIIIPAVLAMTGIIFLFGFKKPLICVAYLALSVGVLLFIADFNVKYTGEISGKHEVKARIESVGEYYAVAEDLNFDGVNYKGKAKLLETEGINVGDIVVFTADTATLGRDIFDTYDMSAYTDNIYYELTPDGEIAVINGKLKFFERVKRRITDPIFRFMDNEDAGIAVSLVFGDKSGLTSSDAELIRGIGMSHVFAVSGLHVGFMMAIIIFLMKRFKAPPLATLIVSATVLLFYGILTGFPSGIKRAAIMSLIYMAAPLLRRKSDTVVTLSAACLIILILNPRELFDIGFIMSVSAVTGIILFYTPIYRFLRRKTTNAVWNWASGGIALTVSANIFLLPVCFNVFNSLAVYMIISNLFILPLVTVAYVMLTVAALFTAVFPFMGVLFYPAQFPVICIRLMSRLIYSFPHAVATVQSMGAATVCYIAGAFFCCRLVKLPYKTKAAGLSLCAVIGSVLLLCL